jgi:hypothetical protein
VLCSRAGVVGLTRASSCTEYAGGAGTAVQPASHTISGSVCESDRIEMRMIPKYTVIIRGSAGLAGIQTGEAGEQTGASKVVGSCRLLIRFVWHCV